MKCKKIIVVLITSFICLNLTAIGSEASPFDYNDIATQNDYYEVNFNVNEISYSYSLTTPTTAATVVQLWSKSEVITIPSSVEYGGKIYTVKYLNFYPWINGVPMCLDTCKELNIPDSMICWSDGLGGEDDSLFKWKNLRAVNISENSDLVEISSGFADCKYLKSFTIPKNLKILDGLTNCPKLKIQNIKICDGNKYFKKKGNFLLSSKGKTLNNYFGNGKSVKVPNGIKKIKNQVFKNNTSIRKITLPKGLKTVSYWTFRDCKNLSQVTIKNTKKSPKFYTECFKNTKKGLKFVVKNKKVAKSLKKQLKDSGVRNAKILIGDTVVYENIKG